MHHPEPGQEWTAFATPTEVAWAAGLFEGEGFMVERRTGRRLYLSVGIEMRDLDVIERFVAIAHKLGAAPQQKVNGSNRPAAIIQRRPRKDHNPRHNDIHRWVTTGHTAERLYLALRDHLGERRREKGDAILDKAHRRAEELSEPGTCPECGENFVRKAYGHHKVYCSRTCQVSARMRDPEAADRVRANKARYRAKRRARRIPCVQCGKPRLHPEDANRTGPGTGLCRACYLARGGNIPVAGGACGTSPGTDPLHETIRRGGR